MTAIRCMVCAHASTNPALMDIPRAAWRFQERLHGHTDPLLTCYRWSPTPLVFALDCNPGCFIHRADFDLVAYYRLPPSADPRDDVRDHGDGAGADESRAAMRTALSRAVGWG